MNLLLGNLLVIRILKNLSTLQRLVFVLKRPRRGRMFLENEKDINIKVYNNNPKITKPIVNMRFIAGRFYEYGFNSDQFTDADGDNI